MVVVVVPCRELHFSLFHVQRCRCQAFCLSVLQGSRHSGEKETSEIHASGSEHRILFLPILVVILILFNQSELGRLPRKGDLP